MLSAALDDFPTGAYVQCCTNGLMDYEVKPMIKEHA